MLDFNHSSGQENMGSAFVKALGLNLILLSDIATGANHD
jgi:hypothetical protein